MNRASSCETDSRISWKGAKTLLSVLVLIGFTAVIAQIVLMRELMVVFYGNEMSLGLMLASWLLWTAIGSSALGRWVVRTRRPRQLMAFLEVLVAATFPFAIFLVRASKAAFESVPGEILGPGPMILTSLVVLSLFCVVSGGLFAAGSGLYAQEAGTTTQAGTSHVYLLEALGSTVGGILASLLLIQYFTSFQIAALLALLNLLGAANLTIPSFFQRTMAQLALLGIFLLLVFPFGCRWVERVSLKRLWSGLDLVVARNSTYGNLAVVQTGGTRTLFENGLVSFNVPEPAAAEEAVHFALLQHPAPKSLLLIGGGLNGSLAQALQHPSLERIDYVELDPTVIDLAQTYFPEVWQPLRADPRIHVHNIDGRLFLRTTDRQFDVILINLPDPQTAQLNRFYTLEFFKEAASRLTSTGVFSFQLKASEEYISPELAEFLRCIHKTIRQVFPEVAALPGSTVHFFATNRAGTLTMNSEELVARLRTRHLRTDYVREYYLPYRMMPDRMLDLQTQIQPQPNTRTNRDFTPIAYYFDVALWSTRFNRAYRRVFQSLAAVRLGSLLGSVGIALFALAGLLCWLTAKRNRARATAGFCVAAMGFTLIGLEMLLLLGFQAIYGYVYRQLAVIIAGFMLGMTLGSRWGLDIVNEANSFDRRDGQRLFRLQLLASLSPILLCLLFDRLAATQNPASVFLVSQILFPVLAVLCGLFGGYQFPVATRIFFSNSEQKTSGTGALYALDLAGACLGAIVLSSYLVPVFGFQATAWIMAVVNLAPAVLAGRVAFGSQTVPA